MQILVNFLVFNPFQTVNIYLFSLIQFISSSGLNIQSDRMPCGTFYQTVRNTYCEISANIYGAKKETCNLKKIYLVFISNAEYDSLLRRLN